MGIYSKYTSFPSIVTYIKFLNSNPTELQAFQEPCFPGENHPPHPQGSRFPPLGPASEFIGNGLLK